MTRKLKPEIINPERYRGQCGGFKQEVKILKNMYLGTFSSHSDVLTPFQTDDFLYLHTFSQFVYTSSLLEE
jgi:hypothetical protein